MKTALITGVSGQGGAHLAKLLIDSDYKVVGTSRVAQSENTGNLSSLGISDQVIYKRLDLQNSQQVLDLIDELRVDEIYHLAAPSSVARSFHEPAETINSIALTTANVLEAVRKTDKTTPCFIATSTEMFGNCLEPATVTTAHDPKSPYGIGKSCAHYQARNYRDAFGLYACSGVFSNFESSLRQRNYVTAKIVSTACKIALGETDKIELGNLTIKRDWGSVNDFMQAAVLSLQQEQANDYLIATGTTHSLQDFLEMAFSSLNLDYRDHLSQKNSLLRPLDIEQTICDPSATEQALNWKANTSLQEVIDGMILQELTVLIGCEQANSMLSRTPISLVRS